MNVETYLISLALSSIITLISIILCPIVADKKNRNPVGWFFLAFVGGLVPLIILLCLKKLNKPYYVN